MRYFLTIFDSYGFDQVATAPCTDPIQGRSRFLRQSRRLRRSTDGRKSRPNSLASSSSSAAPSRVLMSSHHQYLRRLTARLVKSQVSSVPEGSSSTPSNHVRSPVRWPMSKEVIDCLPVNLRLEVRKLKHGLNFRGPREAVALDCPK